MGEYVKKKKDMAFAKYSYKQLRWAVIQKPAMIDAYVEGVLK